MYESIEKIHFGCLMRILINKMIGCFISIHLLQVIEQAEDLHFIPIVTDNDANVHLYTIEVVIAIHILMKTPISNFLFAFLASLNWQANTPYIFIGHCYTIWVTK